MICRLFIFEVGLLRESLIFIFMTVESMREIWFEIGKFGYWEGASCWCGISNGSLAHSNGDTSFFYTDATDCALKPIIPKWIQ